MTNELIICRYLKVKCEIIILGQISHSCGQTIEENGLSNDLKRLYDSGNDSDVKLIVDGHEFKAHKTILMARSEVFAKMFASGMNESQTNIIEITDIEPTIIDIMLRFIYTGKVDQVKAEDWPLLMLAADKYQLNGLKRICVQYLYLNINNSNALKAFSLGDRLNDSQLMNRSMAYIRNEIKDLIQTEDWNKLIEPNPQLMKKIFLNCLP